MSESDDRSYNRVYEALVRSDDDLVGLVAYSLYKQHKRDWLIKFRQVRGVDPDPDQLDAFLLGERLPEQVARYHQAAAEALVDYSQASLAAEEPRIREEAIGERIAAAAHRIEASGRWYRQIPAGIISALIYTVLLIAVLLVLRYAGVDLDSILDRVGEGPSLNVPRTP
jgi:hypothetical protein